MLADKIKHIKHYEETKQKLNNTPAQYKKEFEWLKEVDSLALGNAQMNLQTAFTNFFRDKKVGFPKFKSKKKNKNSYATNNQGATIEVGDGTVKLPKIGLVKCDQLNVMYIDRFQTVTKSNPPQLSVTITKNPAGKYQISILVEYEFITPQVELSKENVIGLDYSGSGFYVDNQNTEADYPKFYRRTLEKLAAAQKRLSNMKFDSGNYKKQKIKVARLHEYIADQRKDWLHKLSTN